jgi:hypothetical protein
MNRNSMSSGRSLSNSSEASRFSTCGNRSEQLVANDAHARASVGDARGEFAG